MKKTTFLLLFASVLMVMGCNPDSEALAEEQRVEIDQYLLDNSLTAEEIEGTGIRYIITTPGTGVENPSEFSNVTVHYEGRLLDGTKFDSSYDRGQPSSFSLQSVITGWKLGIPKFKKGDVGLLVIPSAYAYGSSGQGGIPSNSVLVFDIELIDFD